MARRVTIAYGDKNQQLGDSKEQKLENQKKLVKQAVKQDPFLRYGVAVQSFFELHRKLMWLFAFLSIFAFIQMLVFFAFGGLNYLNEDSMHINSRFSFGNMGFAGVTCGKNVISWDSDTTPLYFQCQMSTYISGVESSGLITPKENFTSSVDNQNITFQQDNLMTICY